MHALWVFSLFAVLFVLFVYLPRNVHFRTLDSTLPPISIKGAFFINMDESKERRERFLLGYNGLAPLKRVSGVKVLKKTGILGKGTYGCALAHAKAMNEVSLQPAGWYLICEDDCVGDFSGLENNIILRNIISRTNKQFINLGRYKLSPYSLSDINLCLQAYLITPAHAARTRDLIIENVNGPHALPVDELVVKLYRTPRYYGQSGDSSGCQVAIFDAFGPSDIALNGR